MNMSSTRMEQVFYNAHSKASHYILRHTSHRFRAIIENIVLCFAICAFVTVILSHRAFVHREDIIVIASYNNNDGDKACDSSGDIVKWEADGNNYNNGGSGGVSIYSILVQLVRGGYALLVQQQQQGGRKSSWPSSDKHVPLLCLKSISGFRDDADVNHILYHQKKINDGDFGSRAFTIYKGSNENEYLVTGSGLFDNHFHHDQNHHPSQQLLMDATTCVIDSNDNRSSETKNVHHHQQQQLTFTKRFGLLSSVGVGQQQRQQTQQLNHHPCPEQLTTFLSHHGYHLPTPKEKNQDQGEIHNNIIIANHTAATTTTYSPIIYSYSHSHGLLSLTPNLLHAHNVSTQFIVPSTADANCFGEPFLKSIIFRLVGPDTVILNWILGLQHHHQNHHHRVRSGGGGVGTATMRPRFVYHWKGKKSIDLDIFDKDHYAFSSRSGGDYDDDDAEEQASINSFLSKVKRLPLYRLFRFLTFRLSVLLSSLFIFFLTTSLVSFTLQETQDRMLEFTLQLKDRVRNRLPLAGLILRHVLENLVFVPIMVGMIFFLIEFYGGDKFLAFSVLSMVWLCEVFSAISIRSIQGIHFFPRVFFLYFTLFHVYFFSCPVGFTYASLASTIFFLFHTILFFWNRYELPALHAGLITPQIPRARIGQVERERWSYITGVGGTATTAPSSAFLHQPHPSNQLGGPMRSAVAAASTSLQSIRSLASIQSLTSSAERAVSPNLIFHGGYNLNDSFHTTGEEDDSYLERMGQTASSEYHSFHNRNS